MDKGPSSGPSPRALNPTLLREKTCLFPLALALAGHGHYVSEDVHIFEDIILPTNVPVAPVTGTTVVNPCSAQASPQKLCLWLVRPPAGPDLKDLSTHQPHRPQRAWTGSVTSVQPAGVGWDNLRNSKRQPLHTPTAGGGRSAFQEAARAPAAPPRGSHARRPPRREYRTPGGSSGGGSHLNTPHSAGQLLK